MLEHYPLEFDNFDNPILPQVIAKNKKFFDPEDILAEYTSNPEAKRRHGELIERKRKEWIHGESDRKLVD